MLASPILAEWITKEKLTDFVFINQYILYESQKNKNKKEKKELLYQKSNCFFTFIILNVLSFSQFKIY